MALTPENFNEDEEIETEDNQDETAEDEEIEPSKTWELNYETGRIGGFIDDEKSIRQFIAKAVSTARDRYMIYDDDYGCDVFILFGQSLTTELIETEIPRYIRDALIYDDRIEDVVDIEVELNNGVLYVEITVELEDEEDITEGVTLYV